MKRQSGILMPVFSLPSKYGIGDFGKEAYNFIDFLSKSKCSVWQVLPLVETGYGNSPYSSVCSYSFNPYFISPELLYEQKLITKQELKSLEYESKFIDYGRLYQSKFSVLRKAFNRFNKENNDFVKFVKSKKYSDYALFKTILIINDYKPFYEWQDGLKYRDTKSLKKILKENKEEILFWNFLQYEGQREWTLLKKYANKKGVKIFGDMPLYVATNSVDVWVNPKLFLLDENLRPIKVAGVPPDYFSKDGQLWGNPIYDYEYHKINGFSWWLNRIKTALKVYDYIRIDHFRGFDRFYAIDSGSLNAREGEWIKVPSKELFDVIKANIIGDRIIAEDLGIIDDGVRELLKYTGFAGMKILSFAFNGDKDNLYLPENITENYVCYTGTHDNDTLLGLILNMSDWDKNNFYQGIENSLRLINLKLKSKNFFDLIDAIILLGFNSKANWFILPFADIIKLGEDYRINTPGIVKEQNWAIKFNKKQFNQTVINRLMKLNSIYKR